jgi:pimeloyl-ACP methyl ester carboxylesterase
MCWASDTAPLSRRRIRRRRLIAAAIACALSYLAVCERVAAQVIPVPLAGADDSPTLTLYWAGAGSKAQLLFIPGGEGQLGLRAGQTDVGHPFYQMLKELSRSPDPGGNLDVVLFDSPYRLAISSSHSGSRATSDHLMRIQSVIEFFRKKSGKRIWLMGHSNGALSVTEYLRYSLKQGPAAQIDGLIVSAANSATYFDSTPLDLPILFMSHRKEGCEATDPTALFRTYEKVRGLDKAPTSFAYIETGSGEQKPPCASGYHMYNGAGAEVVKVLRDFILPFLH